MKYVLLAIFVLIAAQPVQAPSCDVHATQQSTQHGSHDMDHGGGKNMDCCDQDPGMPSDDCNPAFHCGVHSAGVMAFDAHTAGVLFVAGERLDLPDAGEPLNHFIPPPFKPPIA